MPWASSCILDMYMYISKRQCRCVISHTEHRKAQVLGHLNRALQSQCTFQTGSRISTPGSSPHPLLNDHSSLHSPTWCHLLNDPRCFHRLQCSMLPPSTATLSVSFTGQASSFAAPRHPTCIANHQPPCCTARNSCSCPSDPLLGPLLCCSCVSTPSPAR